MSLAPKKRIEGKHCLVPCPPHLCDCVRGSLYDAYKHKQRQVEEDQDNKNAKAIRELRELLEKEAQKQKEKEVNDAYDRAMDVVKDKEKGNN